MTSETTEAGRHGRTVIVTPMRNEGPFVLEWIAYHKAIGFSDIIICSNHCDDGSDALLARLAQLGVIHHIDASASPRVNPQRRAYKMAMRTKVYEEAAWVIALDADEFINIHAGDGTIDALLDELGDANTCSLTWRLFGNGGVEAFSEGFLTEQFTKCAPAHCPSPVQAWGFKTLFKPDYWTAMSPHRPKLPAADMSDQIRWVNGSGEPMAGDYLAGGWRSNGANIGYKHVQLNHYSLRSMESYLVKKRRGRAHHTGGGINFSYWRTMNQAGAEDLSIQARLPGARAIYDELLTDRRVRRLHRACLDKHRTLISELRGDAAYAELFDVLRGVKRAEDLSAAETGSFANTEGGPKSTDRKDGAATEAEDPPESDDVVTEGVAPETEPEVVADWIREIAPGGPRQGFLRKMARHSAVFVERSTDQLVVSFDNLSGLKDTALSREPWAAKFCMDEGYSNLGLMARRGKWWRDAEVNSFFEGLAAEGFFDRFKRVCFVGTSMGAFASLAYAPLAPGSDVMAFSPQTTLDKKIVPWEERFRSAWGADWSLPYSDAAQNLGRCGTVHLFYDPFFEPDVRHAARITGDNIVRHLCWTASHKTPVFLRRAEILKDVMKDGIEGRLTPARFYELYRARKKLVWYRRSILGRASEQGHEALVARIRARRAG